VRICEKLPSYLIKPVPASSETDPPLAKAKPVSDGGSTSVITYLRRGKKTCGETAVDREEGNCVNETTLKKEGEEVPQMLERRLFLWSL